MDPFLTTVAVIVFVALALRFGMWLRMNRRVGKPAPEISEISGRPLGPNERAMLYFYGPHCGACKAMTPVVSSMSETRDNVYVVDISEHPQLTRAFGVMATPTVMLVNKGLVSQVRVGALSQAKLEKMLSSDSV